MTHHAHWRDVSAGHFASTDTDTDTDTIISIRALPVADSSHVFDYIV